jgi:hypothetical protein
VSDTWFCQAGNVPNVELFVHAKTVSDTWFCQAGNVPNLEHFVYKLRRTAR